MSRPPVRHISCQPLPQSENLTNGHSQSSTLSAKDLRSSSTYKKKPKVQQITNLNPGDACDQPDCVQVRAEAGGSQRRGHDRDVPEVQLGEQGREVMIMLMIMLMISCQRLMGTWLTVERKKLSDDSNALMIIVLQMTDDTSVYNENIEN